MEPKHGGLEDEFPFSTTVGYFNFYVNFQGRNQSINQSIGQVEDIMDEVSTFVRIDAQHRDFWQAALETSESTRTKQLLYMSHTHSYTVIHTYCILCACVFTIHHDIVKIPIHNVSTLCINRYVWLHSNNRCVVDIQVVDSLEGWYGLPGVLELTFQDPLATRLCATLPTIPMTASDERRLPLNG